MLISHGNSSTITKAYRLVLQHFFTIYHFPDLIRGSLTTFHFLQRIREVFEVSRPLLKGVRLNLRLRLQGVREWVATDAMREGSIF